MSTIGNNFDTGEPCLTEPPGQVHSGDTQLPDHHRGLVWDDSPIRSLIANVSKSIPIGSVELLETGGERVRFKPRMVEGVPENGTIPRSSSLTDASRTRTAQDPSEREGLEFRQATRGPRHG